MKEHDSPFSVVFYEADDPTAWLPSGDIEAPPWERCFAQFLRQLYDRSRSEKSVRDYRRTLIVFFASSAQGGPPKHPEDYTREDVEDFLHRPSSSSRSKGQPPSVATMNQRLAILSSRAIQKSVAQVKDQEQAWGKQQRCAFGQGRWAPQPNQSERGRYC